MLLRIAVAVQGCSAWPAQLAVVPTTKELAAESLQSAIAVVATVTGSVLSEHTALVTTALVTTALVTAALVAIIEMSWWQHCCYCCQRSKRALPGPARRRDSA